MFLKLNTQFFNLLVVNGVYQNSLYGLAAKLPMKYSMAIVLGAVSIIFILSGV